MWKRGSVHTQKHGSMEGYNTNFGVKAHKPGFIFSCAIFFTLDTDLEFFGKSDGGNLKCKKNGFI